MHRGISSQMGSHPDGVTLMGLSVQAQPSIHGQMPHTARLNSSTMEAMEDDASSEDQDDDDGDTLGTHKDLEGKPLQEKPKSAIKKKTGGSGRRRIDIKFIENKSRRQVTFSRRKRGLMKKVYQSINQSI